MTQLPLNSTIFTHTISSTDPKNRSPSSAIQLLDRVHRKGLKGFSLCIGLMHASAGLAFRMYTLG